MSTNLYNPADHRIYPARWPMYRGKQLFRIIDERSEEGKEELLSVSHITGITPRSQKNVTMFKAESLVGYKKCQVGDIAANTMWTWQGAIGVSAYAGVVSPAYNVYRQNGDYYNPRFLDMLLRERRLVDVYHSISTGIRPSRLRLYPDEFLTIRFPVPPKDEQTQIVRYLDWKTSEINKLINIKRNEIAALRNLGKTIIANAVTQGIEPCEELLNSSVNGFSHVPAHWELMKLKWICSMKSGTNLVSEDINPDYGEYLVYGGNGIRGYYTNYNTDGEYLLIGRQGALCGNIHKVNGQIWATDHAVVTRPNSRLNLDYAFFMLSYMNLNQYANDVAAQPGLSVGKIRNLIAAVPPVSEQMQIADYLSEKTTHIQMVIDVKHTQILSLQELRNHLVSDVVTGTVDVRSIEIPEYEIVVDEEIDNNNIDEETTENQED